MGGRRGGGGGGKPQNYGQKAMKVMEGYLIFYCMLCYL